MLFDNLFELFDANQSSTIVLYTIVLREPVNDSLVLLNALFNSLASFFRSLCRRLRFRELFTKHCFGRHDAIGRQRSRSHEIVGRGSSSEHRGVVII